MWWIHTVLMLHFFMLDSIQHQISVISPKVGLSVSVAIYRIKALANTIHNQPDKPP